MLDESSPSYGDRMMGFAGMERDTVTGLNLAVYRVQNPGTGRWTSQDPWGFGAGDSNLYRGVQNSPTNYADRTGLITVPAPGLPIPVTPPTLPTPLLHFPAPPSLPSPNPNVEYNYGDVYDYEEYLQKMADYYDSKYSNLVGERGKSVRYHFPNAPYSVTYISSMCL